MRHFSPNVSPAELGYRFDRQGEHIGTWPRRWEDPGIGARHWHCRIRTRNCRRDHRGTVFGTTRSAVSASPCFFEANAGTSSLISGWATLIQRCHHATVCSCSKMSHSVRNAPRRSASVSIFPRTRHRNMGYVGYKQPRVLSKRKLRKCLIERGLVWRARGDSNSRPSGS